MNSEEQENSFENRELNPNKSQSEENIYQKVQIIEEFKSNGLSLPKLGTEQLNKIAIENVKETEESDVNDINEIYNEENKSNEEESETDINLASRAIVQIMTKQREKMLIRKGELVLDWSLRIKLASIIILLSSLGFLASIMALGSINVSYINQVSVRNKKAKFKDDKTLYYCIIIVHLIKTGVLIFQAINGYLATRKNTLTAASSHLIRSGLCIAIYALLLCVEFILTKILYNRMAERIAKKYDYIEEEEVEKKANKILLYTVIITFFVFLGSCGTCFGMNWKYKRACRDLYKNTERFVKERDNLEDVVIGQMIIRNEEEYNNSENIDI